MLWWRHKATKIEKRSVARAVKKLIEKIEELALHLESFQIEVEVPEACCSPPTGPFCFPSTSVAALRAWDMIEESGEKSISFTKIIGVLEKPLQNFYRGWDQLRIEPYQTLEPDSL